MKSAPEHLLLVDTLSELLLLRGEVALWRSLFLRTQPAAICFEREQLTLLCTDAPTRGWRQSELALFAGRFDGWCEPGSGRRALLSFTQSVLALRAALLLQKIGAETGVRIALTSAACMVAWFEVDGGIHRLVLPPEDGRAEAALAGVAPGAVVIAPETHEAMEPLLAHEAAGALVATEYDAQDVPHVSITLLPNASAAASTFAGLGLC